MPGAIILFGVLGVWSALTLLAVLVFYACSKNNVSISCAEGERELATVLGERGSNGK